MYNNSLLLSHNEILFYKFKSKHSRQIALHCYADLIKCETHYQILSVFEHFITIFGSKYDSDGVRQSNSTIQGDSNFNFDDTIDEDRMAWYLEWETELNWENSPTKEKKPLRHFTRFYEDLSKALGNLQDLINKKLKNSVPNPYYSRTVLKVFFDTYVPVIPLWAEFCFKFHGDFSTRTNGRSEGMFSHYKTHVFENPRLSPGELVETLFQATVSSYRKDYGLRIPTPKPFQSHTESRHFTQERNLQNEAKRRPSNKRSRQTINLNVSESTK